VFFQYVVVDVAEAVVVVDVDVVVVVAVAEVERGADSGAAAIVIGQGVLFLTPPLPSSPGPALYPPEGGRLHYPPSSPPPLWR